MTTDTGADEGAEAAVTLVMGLMDRMTPMQRSVFLTIAELVRDGHPAPDALAWGEAALAALDASRDQGVFQRLLDASYRVGGPGVPEGRA